jgi:hypothetical protein
MSKIPYLAEVIQTALIDEAEQAGRASRWMRRSAA